MPQLLHVNNPFLLSNYDLQVKSLDLRKLVKLHYDFFQYKSVIFIYYFPVDLMFGTGVRGFSAPAIILSYVQSLCRTFRGSVTSYKIISTDLWTHRNLELVTINSSSPRQNIIFIPWQVKS